MGFLLTLREGLALRVKCAARRSAKVLKNMGTRLVLVGA